MTCIGLDPGPEKSALVFWDGTRVECSFIKDNQIILGELTNSARSWKDCPLVIEKVACYGMPVGEEVFETVFWSGRFAEAYGIMKTSRLTRGEIKIHICGSMRAKDANIRQALIDRFGNPGTRKKKGALYGVSSHMWSALAVAVTYSDLCLSQPRFFATNAGREGNS